MLTESTGPGGSGAEGRDLGHVAVPASEGGGHGSGARILLIEDEPAIRETLSDVLSSEGHSVAAAAAGDEGISLFRRGGFDLVLTDAQMPGPTGWEVARAIKATRGEVPVVVLTGGEQTDGSPADDSGADEVLRKPFDLGDLLALVSRLTEGRR